MQLPRKGRRARAHENLLWSSPGQPIAVEDYTIYGPLELEYRRMSDFVLQRRNSKAGRIPTFHQIQPRLSLHRSVTILLQLLRNEAVPFDIVHPCNENDQMCVQGRWLIQTEEPFSLRLGQNFLKFQHQLPRFLFVLLDHFFFQPTQLVGVITM